MSSASAGGGMASSSTPIASSLLAPSSSSSAAAAAAPIGGLGSSFSVNSGPMLGPQQRQVLCLGFNQDNSCVVAGMEGGFCTFNTEPFAQSVVRTFENGGIGLVELLYRSNILALVGGGSCPQFPISKVMLWDDTKRACVGELSFHSAVKSVLLRKDVVVVALERKVYVYNFTDLEIRHAFDTGPNPFGILALSLEPTSLVLGWPAERVGSLRLFSLSKNDDLVVNAHESELIQMEMNRSGSLIASASEKGTIIRVFCTSSGRVLHELRRGADRAVIYSISFSANSTLLACTSDKCTIHVFELSELLSTQKGVGEEEEQEEEENSFTLKGLIDMAGQTKGVFKDRLGDYLPKYLLTDTKRSVVRFPIQPTVTRCAFGVRPNTIMVAGLDGSFSTYAFDTQSGAHERLFFGSLESDPV